MSLQLSHSEVTGMAESAEAAADLVNGTVNGHSGDNAAAVTALSGWDTAAALSDVMEQWSRKATTCGDSLGYFGASLRSTAEAVRVADVSNSDNVDLVVPDGNPILNAQAPWLGPEATGA